VERLGSACVGNAGGFAIACNLEDRCRTPKREEVSGPPGVTNIWTFTDPEGSNRVGLTMDIPDMDAVMAMMQTQEGADAMAHDGVHPDSMVILFAS
jgi:hypothetical protein